MTTFIAVGPSEDPGVVAARLLELAADPSQVRAIRGEHLIGLVFEVPDDVADAFSEGREDGPTVLVDDDQNPETPPVRRRGRPSKAAVAAMDTTQE